MANKKKETKYIPFKSLKKKEKKKEFERMSKLKAEDCE